MTKRLRMWLRSLLVRNATERELDDEVRFHLEQQTKLYLTQGYAREEAQRKARLDFGSIDNAMESHRDGRGTRSLEDVLGDVRYAIRSLWRDRALTVAGVLTLALGIGATTAVFSAVNAVMLRELPFRDSDRLVALWEENSDRGWHKNVASPANYLDWRDRMRSIDGMAAYTDYATNVTLLGQGDPVLLNAAYTTGNFFTVLGTRPMFGRGFEPGDDWDTGQRPAILSARVWRSLFRGDSGVIGKSYSFGGIRQWQIVGVMPDDFAFPSPATDIWLPMLWNPEFRTQT